MIEHLRLWEIQGLDAQLDAAAGPGHPASVLKPGVTSPNLVAIAGSDGYLFISDGLNRWERQYVGDVAIAPSWAETWGKLFAARQAEAVRHGVTLVNIVAPEKQVIYPEARWRGPLPDAQKRPLKHLLEQIDADARLIYPEMALLAAKETSPAFHRHDSHWTTSGCAAAVAPLLEAVSANGRLADLPLAVERQRASLDLSAHFFDPGPEEDFLLAVAPAEVRHNDLGVMREPGRNTGANYRMHNSAAPDPRRVMVFGDSYAFSQGLAALLSVVFVDVLFLWSKDVMWDLVATRRPDVVVWEGAERFMTTVPRA
jgi:hypothetical protein